MKRLICILYILACFILSYAQNEKQELNKSQLVGTAWIQEDGEYVWKISFFDGYYTSKYGKKGRSLSEHRFIYYLSSDPLSDYDVLNFDSVKVANSNAGAYIIYMSASSIIQSVDYYTIQKISDTELLLFHRATPNSIGGRDILMHFTRETQK